MQVSLHFISRIFKQQWIKCIHITLVVTRIILEHKASCVKSTQMKKSDKRRDMLHYRAFVQHTAKYLAPLMWSYIGSGDTTRNMNLNLLFNVYCNYINYWGIYLEDGMYSDVSVPTCFCVSILVADPMGALSHDSILFIASLVT